jgi:putative FmdB family regulatory protein
MPTYEYRCRNCGHTFDVVQAMSDEALTVCPVCGGGLRKVFAPPAISFKGSGFYATDHGKKSKSGGERSGEKTAASSESSDTAGNVKKDAKEPSKPKEPSAVKGSGVSGSNTGSDSTGAKGSGSEGKKGA